MKEKNKEKKILEESKLYSYTFFLQANTEPSSM